MEAPPPDPPAIVEHARFAIIAASDAQSPRNDTANVIVRRDGSLLVVWHKYRANPASGSDFGKADIACKISTDGGATWAGERIIVRAAEGDLNAQAPALVALRDGTFLLGAMRAHARDSSSMCLFRSTDQGETWSAAGTVWERSQGQWLQGGASGIVLLSSGRLVLPFHFGTGRQDTQHNVGGCFVSDDSGATWRRTPARVELPLRGVMEQSIAELPGGKLVMAVRSQLGTVMMCESSDRAETWSLPWSSGLTAPESCTCLRRLPQSNALVLFWNGCEFYEPKHHHFGQRNPLSAAISLDGGRTWRRLGNIENDPNCEFTNINCTFTPRRDAIVTYFVRLPPFTSGEKNERSDLKCAVISRAYWEKIQPAAKIPDPK